MDVEPTSSEPPRTSEGHPVIPDEKPPAFSKELTSPEHAALQTKDKSKKSRSFLPWSKKAPNDGGSPDTVVENAKEVETSVPVPFLSLFRLDPPTFLTDNGSSPAQVFNSL
jgi:hypothetical protein